jgi:hypothetical protein
MPESKLILGLELINANPSGIDKLVEVVRDEGTHSIFEINVDGNVRIFLSPINEGCEDLIDECVDELDPDETKLNVVVIDQSDDSVRDAQSILEGLKEETDLEDEELTLSMVYDICDFVEENLDLMKKDLESVEDDKEVQQTIKENIDSDDNFLPPEPNTAEQSQNSSDTVIREDGDSSPTAEENVSEETIDNLFEGINRDPVYQKAVEIVNKRVRFSLPEFDEYTKNQLQSEIIELEHGFSGFKDSIVQKVYDKLLEIKSDTEANVEKSNIEPARQAHEGAIQKLQTNHDIDLSKAKQKAIDEYERDRDAYVKATIPMIKAQYDAKYLENHQELLKGISQGIDEDYANKEMRENHQFDEYVENVKTSSINQAWDTINVDDDIAELKEFMHSQLTSLKDKAEKFNGQVEEATENLRKDVMEAKSKQLAAERSEHLLKDTMEQQINAKVAESVSEAKRSAQDSVDHYKARYEQLDAKNQDLKESYETLQKQMEKQKQKYIDDFTNLSEKNTQIIEASKQVNQASGNQPKTVLEKINKYAGIIALLIATLFGAFLIGRDVVGGQQQQTVPTVTEMSPSTSKESSDSTSKADSSLKKGETFDYKTSDGNDVQVIVDSTHAGHYIDKNGKVHSVVF